MGIPRIGTWSETICVNPRASLILICDKILFVGHSLTFGLAKEFNADKKRDKRRCTQIGQCGSDRAGSLPTQCSLSFVSGQTLGAVVDPAASSGAVSEPPSSRAKQCNLRASLAMTTIRPRRIFSGAG